MTSNYFTNILESLAIDTWAILRDSLELDISISEETITDINLLTIKRKNLPEVRIWKCPKDQEANTGVDWEWFIGGNSIGWYRYAIQAKKLCLKGTAKNSYNKLKYKPSNRNKEQIQLLEDYAIATNSIPLYWFYNYKNMNVYLDKDYWVKKIWNCCDPDIDIQQLGCTVTPLEVVQEMIKNKFNTFESIHDHKKTIPWRCLTACPNHKQLFYNIVESSELAIIQNQEVGYFREIPEDREILLNRLKSENELIDNIKIVYGSTMAEDLTLFSQQGGEINTTPKRILQINIET